MRKTKTHLAQPLSIATYTAWPEALRYNCPNGNHARAGARHLKSYGLQDECHQAAAVSSARS